MHWGVNLERDFAAGSRKGREGFVLEFSLVEIVPRFAVVSPGPYWRLFFQCVEFARIERKGRLGRGKARLPSFEAFAAQWNTNAVAHPLQPAHSVHALHDAKGGRAGNASYSASLTWPAGLLFRTGRRDPDLDTHADRDNPVARLAIIIIIILTSVGAVKKQTPDARQRLFMIPPPRVWAGLRAGEAKTHPCRLIPRN